MKQLTKVEGLNKGDVVLTREYCERMDENGDRYTLVWEQCFQIIRNNSKTYGCKYINGYMKNSGFKWIKGYDLTKSAKFRENEYYLVEDPKEITERYYKEA